MKKKVASITVCLLCFVSLAQDCCGQGIASEASACVVNCPVVSVDTPPVCASDGVTYGSECLLLAVQCRNASIVKLHNGKCESSVSTAPTAQPPSVNDAFHTRCTKEPAAHPCKMPCNSAKMQFCGSNNVTYQNPCEFHNAHCETPSLRFKHAGPC